MEKRLISAEKNAPLEKILDATLSGEGNLALDIPTNAKVLENPISLAILVRIAKEEGVKVEILIDGEIPSLEEAVPGQPPENQALKPKLQIPAIFKALVFYRILIVIVVGALSFIGGGLALWYYAPQATITVMVENEVLSKGIEIIASPSAKEVISEQRLIPAQTLFFTKAIEKTIDTTGGKEVGEKASGTTTIYNKTDSEKIFAVGTALYEIKAEGSNLKYVTLEEVKVPPRTADITAEVTTYISGKKDVKVAAEKIGEGYNLAEGEELSVEDFSTNIYIARTNQGISGGTAKTIKTVTEADLKNALDSAQTDLKFKAFEEFKNRVGRDQFFSQEAVYLDSKNYQANHQVGEEAESLVLTQEATYKLLTFYQSDVKNLMNSQVAEFVPPNFSLSSEASDIGIEDIKLVESDQAPSLRFTAKFRGLVVPELNSEELIHNLSGKTVGAASKILDEIPKKTGFEIKISPNLPPVISRLPFREKNIRIEVVSQ